MAATFLIVASMAAATAVSMLVYLTDIAKGLGGLPGIEDQLDDVGDQKAQNFLIIGSDVRPDQSSKGLSDTTMLLRVDPDNAITQLSIPRDLRVNIPGHGIDKFNAAYSYGGPKLTLEVVKQLTDNRIPINHVVNVDFNGFADAVDAIGCVYVDVDRHYFNDNATAASFADQYAEIDIEAGYQRLCGFKALQYVRYRHEDNDIVRAARQQGFLREARQKVPPEKLLDAARDADRHLQGVHDLGHRRLRHAGRAVQADDRRAQRADRPDRVPLRQPRRGGLRDRRRRAAPGRGEPVPGRESTGDASAAGAEASRTRMAAARSRSRTRSRRRSPSRSPSPTSPSRRPSRSPRRR